MNVVYVITRADAVGGATIHVRDLARALIAEGNQATVLVGGEGAVTREMESAGIPVVSLRHLHRSIDPFQDAMAVRETARAIRNLRPDVVSAHTAKAGCIARLACLGMRVPVVYTPHGWAIGDRLSRGQGALYRVVERATAPMASTIVNVCEYERRLARRYGVGSPQRHTVIHNGMPDVEPALRARPAVAPPRLVMVARFEEPKDHSTLIEALAGLKNLDWLLTLVGDGPLEEKARRLVDRHGLAGRVDFVGQTGRVERVLAASQVFVLASRSEAFPRSILEAMRAGLPVVASRVGGVAEAVEDGRSGLLAQSQSAAALRTVLARLIEDPVKRERYGAEGRRIYERKFTFSRMLRETLSVYEGLAGSPVMSLPCGA